jgi:hypothetical protein
VTTVLNLATESSSSPDLRDRAFVYWRLLSTDPDAAQAIVLARRPPIDTATTKHSPELLDTLISYMSTLSSVYHMPPEYFLKSGGGEIAFNKEGGETDEDESSEEVLILLTLLILLTMPTLLILLTLLTFLILLTLLNLLTLLTLPTLLTLLSLLTLSTLYFRRVMRKRVKRRAVMTTHRKRRRARKQR